MKIRSGVVAGDGIGIDPNGGPPARPRAPRRPRPDAFRTGGAREAAWTHTPRSAPGRAWAWTPTDRKGEMNVRTTVRAGVGARIDDNGWRPRRARPAPSPGPDGRTIHPAPRPLVGPRITPRPNVVTHRSFPAFDL